MQFSEEIWADWESRKQEQFGSDWGTVLAILSERRRHGIHMLDPSPSNIRFNDEALRFANQNANRARGDAACLMKTFSRTERNSDIASSKSGRESSPASLSYSDGASHGHEARNEPFGWQ